MSPRKHLNAAEKQETRYCIPLWLRDLQIQEAITRVKDRIQPHEAREEPIAIVCFGPSLQQTWEQVKDFKYVMSCSGSHKFLVEHGIIPNWHVEVDPREHKVGLIGPPQQDTTYLISSTCHRKVFDHLEGHTVQLWHVFDASEDGKRLLPPGEWAITGGCDVGLRALTIAGFLGFRDLHVFGMDHSAGTVDAPLPSRHAAFHPNTGESEKYATCEYDGRHFLTTAGMLEAARQVWHELDQMPAVKATFYGDGLCQAMSRHYVPKPVSDVRAFAQVVAVQKPELISAEYLALNAKLHHDNLAYGVGGGKHAETVKKLVSVLAKQDGDRQVSVLDYGCGKSYLQKSLSFPIFEYDPAIEGKSDSPRPADLCVCTDVLEHIEPDKLLYVLDDLRRCTRRFGFIVVHTGPAQKVLADGRNAHLIQRGEHFWRKQLSKFFVVESIRKAGVELHIAVTPLKRKQKAA
jgi:hypothetical protein